MRFPYAMAGSATPHVLVVEDHPATSRIISRVLNEVDPEISADVVRDGSECLSVLNGEHESIKPPDIVLLDLDLLEVDGLTVLERRAEGGVKGDTPILVISGENDAATILECYRTGANTFFSKPDDLEGYLSLGKSIVDHWLVNAELPRHNALNC